MLCKGFDTRSATVGCVARLSHWQRHGSILPYHHHRLRRLRVVLRHAMLRHAGRHAVRLHPVRHHAVRHAVRLHARLHHAKRHHARRVDVTALHRLETEGQKGGEGRVGWGNADGEGNGWRVVSQRGGKKVVTC